MELSALRARLPSLFTEETNIETINNLIPELKREAYSRSQLLSFLVNSIPEINQHINDIYPLLLTSNVNWDLISNLLEIGGISGRLFDLPSRLYQLYKKAATCELLIALLLPSLPVGLNLPLALLDAVIAYERPSFSLKDVQVVNDKILCLDTGLRIPLSCKFRRTCVNTHLGFMSDSLLLFTKVQDKLLGGVSVEKANEALAMITEEGRGRRYVDLDDMRKVNSTTTSKKTFNDHERRFTSNNGAFFAYITKAILRLPPPPSSANATVNDVSTAKEVKEKKTRRKIPEPVRFAVWKAHCGEGFTGSCFCCCVELKFESWECGHIKSDACGGTVEQANLRPLCLSCNRSMGKEHMYEYIRRTGLPGIKNISEGRTIDGKVTIHISK